MDNFSEITINYLNQLLKIKLDDISIKKCLNYLEDLDDNIYENYKDKFKNKLLLNNILNNNNLFIGEKEKNDQNKNKIIYIFDPNCYYCKKFEPIWLELSNKLIFLKIKYKLKLDILSVNYGETNDILNKYNISGTPTLIFDFDNIEQIDGYIERRKLIPILIKYVKLCKRLK